MFFVPSFTGIYSPYWREDSVGTIKGISGYTNKAHIVQAAIEAICYRTRDVIESMEKDSNIIIKELRVDGGLSINDFLM